MRAWHAVRRLTGIAGVLAITAAFACAPLRAQVSSYGDKAEGENTGDQLPRILQKVQVAQRLGAQLPLSAPFVDDHGQPVTLGKYFDGKHPAIVSMVYYNCPMLCSEEMDGVVSSLMMVPLVPGKDFQLVFVSIDPTETPELAAQTKARYLKRYGHPGTADGWHFLTGTQTSIDAMAQATGFGFVRVAGPDGKMDQFAHASAIEVATPNGKLAQYYLGVVYPPDDVLRGLIGASGYKIGSPMANILTYCYHYDPQIDKSSLRVVRAVQMGGILTVAGLGSFIFLMFRRDQRLGQGVGHDGQPLDRDKDSDLHQSDDDGETDKG